VGHLSKDLESASILQAVAEVEKEKNTALLNDPTVVRTGPLEF
jgi:hypothetical protein